MLTDLTLLTAPVKFQELRNRAEELLRDYENSSAAFVKGKQNREALVELGAEYLRRSDLQVPKKVTRAFGSSGSPDWKYSEQYKTLIERIERLVREVEDALRLLKGRQPSLRGVHQAVKPETKLRRLAGVLTTAERYASTSGRRKKRKRVPKRGPSHEVESVRGELERRMRHFPTLTAIGVTAMLGFASIFIGLRLDLPMVILLTLAGTIIVVWLTDELLRRG